MVSIPTVQFYDNNISNFCQQLGITRDRLKFRGDRTGYCGGASILLHLDEMVRNGELKTPRSLSFAAWRCGWLGLARPPNDLLATVG